MQGYTTRDDSKQSEEGQHMHCSKTEETKNPDEQNADQRLRPLRTATHAKGKAGVDRFGWGRNFKVRAKMPSFDLRSAAAHTQTMP